MFARSCLISSSTAVNPILSNLWLSEVDDRASIVLPRRQRRIERCVPSVYSAINSVGGIFVRTCNNFRLRRILSCTFAVNYLRRVHLYRRSCYCFVDLFLFLFIRCLFCYLNEKCGEITRICKYIENSSFWVIWITASRWYCIKIILYYYYCYYYDV